MGFFLKSISCVRRIVLKKFQNVSDSFELENNLGRINKKVTFFLYYTETEGTQFQNPSVQLYKSCTTAPADMRFQAPPIRFWARAPCIFTFKARRLG